MIFHKLTSKSGSRQGIEAQQGTEILRNLELFSTYLSTIRVESDPNNLVEVVWRGLTDRFVMGCLRFRSLIDICFYTPVVMFTHNKQAKVTIMFKMMEVIRDWISSLSSIDDFPPLQQLSMNILEKLGTQLPELKPM